MLIPNLIFRTYELIWKLSKLKKKFGIYILSKNRNFLYLKFDSNMLTTNDNFDF